jgi:integrase
MASLEQRTGGFRIVFRYGGNKYQHTLKTTDEKEARACQARVEECLHLLERGLIELPHGANLPVFLITGGKLNTRPTVEKPLTLRDLFERYHEALPDGVKEQDTRCTERIHTAHLQRLLGERTPVHTITTALLQNFVEARAQEKGRRGQPVSHATFRKEIGTFATVWNKWAMPLGLVRGPAPTRGLIYRKTRSKPPFQTLEQVERQIARGGLSDVQELELWDSLFLTLPHVADLLAFVKENARRPFVYPMFVFAAHTGARRSEILRSCIDDFDFGSATLTIREKKKDKLKEGTFRTVPLSALLCEVMAAWFAQHPGGRITICEKPNAPLTKQLAAHHFRWALAGGKWQKLRGWHVFRHSFVSNCAAKGIDQRMIDTWTGHQTEEMRRRYRHLFPEHQQQAIRLVFGQG